MYSQPAADKPGQLTTLTLIVFAVSIVFFFVLANGYYNLFLNKGQVTAGVIGTLLAFIAWSLGKFIGSSDSGIKGHLPLFALMLILSAVGVFNYLMINLEGKRIFQEAVDSAVGRFKELPLLAKTAMRDPAIEEKIARIQSLEVSLAQEIRNPRNCGEGPEARRILAEIAKELPGFTVLSGGTRSCKDNEEFVQLYHEQVEERLKNHPDLINKNYRELIIARDRIIETEASAQPRLESIRSEINNGGNLLIGVRPHLERLASEYQTVALDIKKYAPSDVAEKTEPNLDLAAVRNLGEWSQIITLLVSRLDKVPTYVYLFLALFADFILIYLFSLLKNHKAAQPKRKTPATQSVSNPW